MKSEDWNLTEIALQNAYDTLNEDLFQVCDTSCRCPEHESKKEVEDWNRRLEEVMNEIQCLRAEMIFTFRLED